MCCLDRKAELQMLGKRQEVLRSTKWRWGILRLNENVNMGACLHCATQLVVLSRAAVEPCGEGHWGIAFEDIGLT